METRQTARAWITNIAFPTTLRELLIILTRDGGLFDVEKIRAAECNIPWTAPAWAKRGDTVFFMHSVSAISKIRALRRQLATVSETFTEEERAILEAGLARAMELYRAYGGRIIGVARLSGDPVRGFTESFRHWRCSTYAVIADTYALPAPVDRLRFRDFIPICRTGAVTPLFEEALGELLRVIGEDNPLPAYVTQRPGPAPLPPSFDRDRSAYTSEEQFRACFVDALLAALSPVVYRECRCRKSGVPDSFADNVILLGERFIPVEIKLDRGGEAILSQLWKYCRAASIETSGGTILTPDRLHARYAILIDREAVFVYDADRDALSRILDLDDLRYDTPEDLRGDLLRFIGAGSRA